jgi:hypothetical protein
MELKPFMKIIAKLLNKIARKFKKDKWFLFKILLYTGYMYMCFSKFKSSIVIMSRNFRNMKSGQRKLYTMISLFYLLAVFLQIGSLLFKEMTLAYKKMLFQVKLSCYEISFKDRQNSPDEMVSRGEDIEDNLIN